MIRYTSRVTGHKNDKARCFIPFHTERFFATAREDGEITATKEPKQVKFPVKLDENEEDTRANTTYVKVNVIDYFDSDVESLLGTFSVLEKRLIKPKNLDDEGQEARQFLAYLANVCSETARSTLESVKKDARKQLWTEELAENGQLEVQEDQLIADEQTLYNLIDGDWADVPEEYDDVGEYRVHLLTAYRRNILNNLHQITFGADAYRAHYVQKKYLREQINKPYDATVEASFRRIDVLANMLEHFPPSCKKATLANETHWLLFDDVKGLNDDELRDIKFNMLPASYQERLDNLEEDWTEMTSAKFLSEAQKCETADLRDRLQRKREKAKKDGNKKKKHGRKHHGAEDDGSDAPPSKKKRGNFQRKNERQTRESSRPARECILCKLAGAPESVYKTHNAAQCRKVDQHSKKLQSRSSKSYDSRGREQRFTEVEDDASTDGEVNLASRTCRLEKKLKKVSLQNKNKKKKKKKSNKSESGYRTSSSFWDVDSSSSEESDF